jgi:hypothetical protein
LRLKIANLPFGHADFRLAVSCEWLIHGELLCPVKKGFDIAVVRVLLGLAVRVGIEPTRYLVPLKGSWACARQWHRNSLSCVSRPHRRTVVS